MASDFDEHLESVDEEDCEFEDEDVVVPVDGVRRREEVERAVDQNHHEDCDVEASVLR